MQSGINSYCSRLIEGWGWIGSLVKHISLISNKQLHNSVGGKPNGTYFHNSTANTTFKHTMDNHPSSEWSIISILKQLESVVWS